VRRGAGGGGGGGGGGGAREGGVSWHCMRIMRRRNTWFQHPGAPGRPGCFCGGAPSGESLVGGICSWAPVKLSPDVPGRGSACAGELWAGRLRLRGMIKFTLDSIGRFELGGGGSFEHATHERMGFDDAGARGLMLGWAQSRADQFWRFRGMDRLRALPIRATRPLWSRCRYGDIDRR